MLQFKQISFQGWVTALYSLRYQKSNDINRTKFSEELENLANWFKISSHMVIANRHF